MKSQDPGQRARAAAPIPGTDSGRARAGTARRLGMPGPQGKIISKQGAVVEPQEFEDMKSEYYRLRGWDVETGFLTESGLAHVGLQEITDDLEKKGLLGQKTNGLS